MRTALRWTLHVSLSLLVAGTALAQPPAESCGGGDSTSGTDTLPIDLFSTPSTDDFNTSGPGCIAQAVDNVTCLTPTADCTPSARCYANPGGAGLSVTLNVFDGPCTGTPSSCAVSTTDGSDTGATPLINVPMTAGATYCFVCESTTSTELHLQIVENVGSCGALPVTLRAFSVD